MDGLEAQLSAFLADPERMGQLRQLAGMLGGAMPPPTAPDAPAPAAAPDPGLAALLGRVMSVYGAPSDASKLVEALCPWLQPERGQRLQQALQIARLLRAARTVLPELGGKRHV